ncbi:MurG-like transferase [Botrimarina colliarenosi]|uniref:MurG-like transferase n=1 Tax=Botrimarina colliarenosi TaxID=2528001 RepID=A0A5C6AIU8_9BACT|nr:glycosyltransferase [Botrimarina colliarenosi]TWT99095.1 MurG-like transferase [Botrimarina colliarenosi]
MSPLSSLGVIVVGAVPLAAMHFLLTALGSYGDVFPMIGLGASLQARGHAVTLATNPYFADEAAAANLTMVEVGTAEDYVRMTRNRSLWGRTSGLEVVFREAAIGLLEPLYKLVTERAQPGETLVIAHGLDLASRVAAESRGVSVTSLVYAPMALWSNLAPPRLPAGFASPRAPLWLHRLQFLVGDWFYVRRVITPPLEAFRASHGLPPLEQGFFDWYYGVAPPLCLFPDWFVSPSGATPADWPRGTVTTGFPLGDSAGGRDELALAEPLEAFLDAGTPPIVFTPGSAMRYGERFFAAAIDACGRLGRRGVLLTKYPEQLPAALPDTVIAPGFTPLGRLLPRSAGFVHHGGIGSSARGLAAGVPQLIQPMAFDQFDNAWRLRRLGVADELRAERFSGERAAKKLGRLLESSAVAEATRTWKERCDAPAALAAACDELERRFATQ